MASVTVPRRSGAAAPGPGAGQNVHDISGVVSMTAGKSKCARFGLKTAPPDHTALQHRSKSQERGDPRRGWLGPNLVGSALSYYSAVMQERNPIGDLECLLLVVRDVDRGNAGLPQEPAELIRATPASGHGQERRVAHPA